MEHVDFKDTYRPGTKEIRNCHINIGTGKEIGYVTVGGKSISQLVDLPIHDLKEFFRTLELDAHDTEMCIRDSL